MPAFVAAAAEHVERTLVQCVIRAHLSSQELQSQFCALSSPSGSCRKDILEVT